MEESAPRAPSALRFQEHCDADDGTSCTPRTYTFRGWESAVLMTGPVAPLRALLALSVGVVSVSAFLFRAIGGAYDSLGVGLARVARSR